MNFPLARRTLCCSLGLAAFAVTASAAPTTLPATQPPAGVAAEDAAAADRLLDFAAAQNRAAAKNVGNYSYDFVAEYFVAGRDRPRSRQTGTIVRCSKGTYSEYHDEPVDIPPGDPGFAPSWYRCVETPTFTAVNQRGTGGFYFERLLDGEKSAESTFWRSVGTYEDPVWDFSLAQQIPADSFTDLLARVRSSTDITYQVFRFQAENGTGDNLLWKICNHKSNVASVLVMSLDGSGRLSFSSVEQQVVPIVRHHCEYGRLADGSMILRRYQRDYYEKNSPGQIESQTVITTSNVRTGDDVDEGKVALDAVSPDKPLRTNVYRSDESKSIEILFHGKLVPEDVYHKLLPKNDPDADNGL